MWRAIDGATVLQQGSHFPGSRSNERSEKREERRDEKKKPPEMLKLTARHPMASKTFAMVFGVPELNRHLGQHFGADHEGLRQRARICLASPSLAGHPTHWWRPYHPVVPELPLTLAVEPPLHATLCVQ